MSPPKAQRMRKSSTAHDEVEQIARRIFWEEAPRLQREIYEGELKRLREMFERECARAWDAIHELAEAQKRTEERLDRLEDQLSRLEAVVAELAEAQKRSEERLDRLEAVVAELAEAQKRTEERLDRVEGRLSGVEDRLDRMEGRLSGVEDRLSRVEGRLDRVEERLDRVEARLDRVENRLDGVENRLGRVEGRLDKVEEIVARLAEAQERTYQDVQELKKHYRALSNIIGADLEVDAEEMLSWVLRKRGYTILGRASIKDTNGDVDVAMHVRSPEGEDYWALVEAKARLRGKEYLQWVRKLQDASYQKKLQQLGMEPPWLGYAFALRVYDDVLEMAPEYGVGILDVHGEQVQARPLYPTEA